MDPLVASTEDLISVLDRVLDKGIVFEPWVRITLHGIQLVSVDARLAGRNLGVESAAVYVGYEKPGVWVELDRSANLFPLLAARPVDEVARTTASQLFK